MTLSTHCSTVTWTILPEGRRRAIVLGDYIGEYYGGIKG